MPEATYAPANKKIKTPRFTLELKQETINSAKQRDSSHCMYAETVKQQIPESQYVSVDLQTIRFTLPKLGIRCVYLTPRVCQEQLINFDQGEDVVEHRFQLRGAHVMPYGRRGERKPIISKDKTPQATMPEPKKKRKKAARLETPNDGHNACSVPVRVGGRAPPMMKQFGRRREFGLRILRK